MIHGSALRTVPAWCSGRACLPLPSWRNNRTSTNTSAPMIGSMTRVTAAPAPYCSCRIALE
jgi:hypothetical protein